MIIQHDVGRQADVHLPKRLAEMDIRDLIKPEPDSTLKVENPSPPLSRVQATANNTSLRSSISLPSLPAPLQVLPSPSDLTKFPPGSSAPPLSQAAYYSQPGQPPLAIYQQSHNPVYQPAQTHQQPGRWPASFASNKRSSPPDDGRQGPPPKRQSKWNPEEDRKIIAYRGQGMKWSEISARLYPRTEIGCRLHYQNYLEKRSDWDEEKKNKLARVYERVKEDMWKLVANEMKIPWRSAEGMHWIMGETEMARRANVTPFSNTIHSCSTSSSTTATVYNNVTTNGNSHHRASVYRDNSNTIVFEPEQLAALKAPPESNGPVSTFASGGLGLPKESVTSDNASSKASSKAYADPVKYGPNDQPHAFEVDKDGVSLSPRSDRAMRDISPRTYQAMREKKARLPSVSEMEYMVRLTGPALSTGTGGGLRKESEDGSVGRRWSHDSASARAEDIDR